MRHVKFDLRKLTLPAGWREKASDLLKQLEEAPDATVRADIIGKNEIWADIKLQLKALNHRKCWYTDTNQDGADVDIDHFRPKKRVKELVDRENPHTGYWWLTYVISNYRYSCIVANRRRKDVEAGRTGGKADHFPIWDEAHRANTPAAVYADEKPLLIDPCVETDVKLIIYKEDGEAIPRFGDSVVHAYKNLKAAKSIELYSLNHSDFVNARIELRDKIDELCGKAARHFNKLEDGDGANVEAYTGVIQELGELKSETKEHSSFCSAMIERFRHEEYMYALFDA